MTRESVEKYILETYGCSPDYPWYDKPNFAVFRHHNNSKWFGVIMDLSKRKLGVDSDEIIDVMNLKCDTILIGSLINEKGFYLAYHMNKTYWITVALDGSVDDGRIKWLIDMSYDLTKKKVKK